MARISHSASNRLFLLIKRSMVMKSFYSFQITIYLILMSGIGLISQLKSYGQQYKSDRISIEIINDSIDIVKDDLFVVVKISFKVINSDFRPIIFKHIECDRINLYQEVKT